MEDVNGFTMTEEMLFEEACGLVADACCILFETESSEGHAAAFMADYLLKYLQVVKRDDDVLSAAADYTAYENKVYRKFIRDKRLAERKELKL